MAIIRVTAWKAGFCKVQFGSLLRECCGFSLSTGKRHVDSVLEGRPISVTVAKDRSAYFLERALLVGAICESEEK
jgi:hypothetical protein